MKTRNGIIICPHPRALKSTIEAARIVVNIFTFINNNDCYNIYIFKHDAAVSSGAPKNIINWVEHPDRVTSELLMRHSDISLIIGI